MDKLGTAKTNPRSFRPQRHEYGRTGDLDIIPNELKRVIENKSFIANWKYYLWEPKIRRGTFGLSVRLSVCECMVCMF